MSLAALTASLICLAGVSIDGPQDNLPDKVRPVPPPGVELPAADRERLRAGADKLGAAIAELRGKLKDKPALAALLPDVEVYHKAVHDALKYNEFFHAREIAIADRLLDRGLDRARSLEDGKAPWTTASGLVVRGYVSKIDGSVQPYGLVVPASYQPGGPHRHRLDFWFHGRGETLSELNFIDARERLPGEFTPRDAFVLHPYGRYCNANKLAGEVDAFEALDHVRRNYSIDENRLVVRGFSMGGAACWQFAVHHAGLWAAAAPGAGFSETPDFLRVFQNETLDPPAYERTLWHLYDCTDYAANLFNCPVVAYSGEIDKQKQAADIMARAMADENLPLVHVIGPKTGHSYHPQAKDEINRRIDSIVAPGRNPVPRRVRFTTWTLRYNEMLWVTVDGLDRHWQRARVDAEIASDHEVRVTTENVAALTLAMPPGLCPLDAAKRPTVHIDGQVMQVDRVQSDRSWVVHFRRIDKNWTETHTQVDGVLRKRHGLQGPIDDAFMDRFVMVRPTGKPLNEKIGAWVAAEMEHATTHWRRQFRGEAPVKADTEITDADIASSNLVLWGDPQSNRVLARIAERLPIQWTAAGIRLTGRSPIPNAAPAFDSAHHVPVMIYPNPLNPQRYVVLNSGFTFREYDYLNNARQVPKLPDWSIVDVTTPANSRWPGRIAAADFFDEQWQLQSPRTAAALEPNHSPVASGAAIPAPPRGYSIPLIDLAGDKQRQVVVDRETGQYLGHPATVLLEDGKTILCVYPKGHGRGPIVYKRSSDGGRTWSDRLPTPASWATSRETPTIHRVVDASGRRRLILWSGLYPARLATSDDDGATWSELEPTGDWGGIVVMGFVEPIRTGPGRYLAMFHDDGRFFTSQAQQKKPVVFTLYKTTSDDGGLTWSRPASVFASSDVHLCEPGCIRSPDGKQLAVLLRENSRTGNSHVIFSNDEGATWSRPRELPGSLTGDRHVGRYSPDGRLFISFRDRTHESSTQGDWVAWVGRYDDIVASREGQYRVRLMDNTKGADCAYPGVEVLPDGTIVTTTYGHWDEGQPPYVVSVRLKLDELDVMAAKQARASCGDAAEDDRAKLPPTAAPPPLLSDEQALAGWIALFDRETTFGWSGAKLRRADGRATIEGGRTTTEFANYELQVDVVREGEIRLGGQPAKVTPGKTTLWSRGQRGPIELGEGVAIASIALRPVATRPLFNGRDLDGWERRDLEKQAQDKRPKWSVEQGAIRAVGGPGALEYAPTDQPNRFGDLILQIDARMRREHTNGGLFVRNQPGTVMMGYEAQLHNRWYDHSKGEHGYTTGGIDDRQQARRPIARDGAKFRMTVIAHGAHLATWVNGYQTTDWTDPREPHENPRRGRRVEPGTIQLQAHDPETDLEFHAILLGELP